MKKLFTNLTFWVLTAITLGVLLGHFRPDLALMKVLEEPIKGRFLGQELEIGATFSEMLGKTFISIVKLFINPIIFLTITQLNQLTLKQLILLKSSKLNLMKMLTLWLHLVMTPFT